jgi:hypothetical protein
VAAIVTPTLAKSRAMHPGEPAEVSAERAQALRDCNNVAAPFRDYGWGVTQIDCYRSCMAQRRQPE